MSCYDNGKLIPCMAHGDYVKVEGFALDHAQPKDDIRNRQRKLVEKINSNLKLKECVMGLDGIDKFFIEASDGQIYGTLFYYKIYMNGIHNLWLICETCNRAKNDDDPIQWFKTSEFYGKLFTDTITQRNGLLLKNMNGIGIATAAISFFWKHHSTYAKILKNFTAKVVDPVHSKNKKSTMLKLEAEQAAAEGTPNAKKIENKAKRKELNVDLKVRMLSAASGVKMGLPPSDDESSDSDSDPQISERLALAPPNRRQEVAKKAGEKTAEELPAMAKKLYLQNIDEYIAQLIQSESTGLQTLEGSKEGGAKKEVHKSSKTVRDLCYPKQLGHRSVLHQLEKRCVLVS